MNEIYKEITITFNDGAEEIFKYKHNDIDFSPSGISITDNHNVNWNFIIYNIKCYRIKTITKEAYDNTLDGKSKSYEVNE